MESLPSKWALFSFLYRVLCALCSDYLTHESLYSLSREIRLNNWVSCILIHWGEHSTKEHKAGASSIDVIGQYLAYNCAMLTYFNLGSIQ